MTDDDIIAAIIKREGGYVNNPSDAGGATNFGITRTTLGEWRGHVATEADVETMTETEAVAIYRQRYLVDPGLFKIKDDRLRAFLVDAAVNHGPKNAVMMLQRALKVTHDGVLGNDTFLALVGAEPAALYRRAVAERVRTYGRIIAADHSQAVFASGWLNRVAEFVEGA